MEIESADFLIGDDTKLDFNIDYFNFIDDEKKTSRHSKPVVSISDKFIGYKKAKELAKEITLAKNESIHAIINGDFIFGDFIEALLVEKNVKADNVYISTLSLSQNNIDSIEGLIEGGYIDKLTLMISNYFYSHEKNQLLPYLLRALDRNNNFNLLVCRNHTKVCLLEISNLKIIITGSANLRSNNSIEQFTIQENEEIYNFYLQFFNDYKKYNIINKEV